MIAKLIPLDGSPPITIRRDVTVVGRQKSRCDLVVQHTSISKLHCVIARTDGLLFIRDLGSTNGTKVNGQRITRGALLPGDELTFASVGYRVHLGPGEPKEAGVPKPLPPATPDREESDPFAPSPDSDSDVRLLPDDSQADFARS